MLTYTVSIKHRQRFDSSNDKHLKCLLESRQVYIASNLVKGFEAINALNIILITLIYTTTDL